MMMEAAHSSTTLEETCKNAWCKNPKDHNLSNMYCGNLKTCTTYLIFSLHRGPSEDRIGIPEASETYEETCHESHF